MSGLRRRLLEVPLGTQAQERAWPVVRSAYAEREPVVRRRPLIRPALALAVALAVVAGIASAPGRAVLSSIKEQFVGEKHAAPALFSLPAPGSLIVDSAAGPWIVQRDGSRRLLGDYDALTWSPHARFVVGMGTHQLAALEPDGAVHWTLARPGPVTRARWSPGKLDTRIAYFSGQELRVVGGDGKGDRLLSRTAALVAPAWVPQNEPHLLAFADRRGGVHLVDVDRPAPLRPAKPGEVPAQLAWTPDGKFLLALGARTLRILAPNRRLIGTLGLRPGPHELAPAPRGHRVALTERIGGRRSEVVLYDPASPSGARQRIFAGAGDFNSLAWSPDGRWLLVGWPTANQWLFVRTSGPPKLLAVSNIARQFGSPAFPTFGGWCC